MSSAREIYSSLLSQVKNFDTHNQSDCKQGSAHVLLPKVAALKSSIYSETENPELQRELEESCFRLDNLVNEWLGRLWPRFEPSIRSIQDLRERIASWKEWNTSSPNLLSSVEKLKGTLTYLHFPELSISGCQDKYYCFHSLKNQLYSLERVLTHDKELTSLQEKISEIESSEVEACWSDSYTRFMAKISQYRSDIKKMREALTGFNRPVQQIILKNLAKRIEIQGKRYSRS